MDYPAASAEPAVIHKLPNELVLEILAFIGQLEQQNSPWRWRLAHVCKRWRAVLFAYPTLWTRPLLFNHNIKISRFRAESQLFQPDPLCVKLELVQCEPIELHNLRAILAPQIPRISRLELSAAASQWNSLSLDRYRHGTYPLLSALSIFVGQKTTAPLEMTCPVLQSLSLNNVLPKSWDKLVSHHLTQLTLENARLDSSDFRRVLQLGYNIEMLCLRNFGFLDAPDQFTYPLPHLHELSISDTHPFVVKMIYIILRARNVREVTTYAKYNHPGDFERYLRVDDLPHVHSMRLDPWDCSIWSATGVRRTCTYLGDDMLRYLVFKHSLSHSLCILNIAMSMWHALVKGFAASGSLRLPRLKHLTIRLDSRGAIHGKELVEDALSDGSQCLRCPRLEELTVDGRQGAGWPLPNGPLILQLTLALGSEALRSLHVANVPLMADDKVALNLLRTDYGLQVDYSS